MASAAHNSKENAAGNFFGCKICCLRGVPFNDSTLKAHLQTKGHKFMKVISSNCTKFTQKYFSFLLFSVLFENDLWPEPFVADSSSSSKKVEPRIFRFLNAAQSTSILCRLCGCVLNDADLLFDHQLEESHKKNLVGLNAISCPTVYFCPPCDVMLLGIENYSAHCLSSSHNKNLDSAYQTSVVGPKFLLPDDPKTNYTVTVKNDKCSRKRSKSPSSAKKRSSGDSKSRHDRHHRSSKKSKSSDVRSSSAISTTAKVEKCSTPAKVEKSSTTKKFAEDEEDPLRLLVQRLAKNLGNDGAKTGESDAPSISTVEKSIKNAEPKMEKIKIENSEIPKSANEILASKFKIENAKIDSIRHEEPTTTKSLVNKLMNSLRESKTTTTKTIMDEIVNFEKIDNSIDCRHFLEKFGYKISDQKTRDREKSSRLSKLINFLSNFLLEEKFRIKKDLQNVEKLEILLEKFREEKIVLEGGNHSGDDDENFEKILKAVVHEPKSGNIEKLVALMQSPQNRAAIDTKKSIPSNPEIDNRSIMQNIEGSSIDKLLLRLLEQKRLQ